MRLVRFYIIKKGLLNEKTIYNTINLSISNIWL